MNIRLEAMCKIWAVMAICFVILFVVIAGSSFAVPEGIESSPRGRPPVVADEPGERPRRIPPQQAIDVCTGKKEQDPCTFNSPRGVLSGLCLSGVENVFACRPHRAQFPPETGQDERPGQRPVPQATVQPEKRPAAATTGEPEHAVSPLPHRSATPATAEPAAAPTPAVSALPSEQPPPRPPPPVNDFIDQLGENAGGFGSSIIVAFLAAGLTWFAFFRYSTVPLRRLRTVTQQLAGGDLSARVGEGVVRQKTEVADLGRDVDRMAERIESLVVSHRRLIRDVSHELRSPLARLNVALELARQSAGPAHTAPFDRIERESDRLNELIGQLLMLTKLESDNGVIKRTDFDIAALIAEIAQDADFEARGNDRRVVIEACASLMFNGNKELIRQAIENLVRNAARYTAAGTAVEISLRKKESGGRSWAHIEVRDQGPGVPESELHDIFRPFYRVSDSRERQSGGTGVGLAISDGAVRLHGGSLRAFNSPGAGLIMKMALPIR